jgi:NitT/TauT family transport system permease protein
MERLKLHLLQILAAAALVGLWELAAELHWVNQLFVSNPGSVARSTWHLVTHATTYAAIWVTTQEILLGMLIGCVAGVATGVALGVYPYAYRVFSPIIGTLYTVPRLALLPLFVLWFGLDKSSKVALVVSLVYFSMLLNTYSGVREIDQRLVDAVRLMGGGRATILREVMLPSTMPWILAGLRVSLVFAVTGAVIGEMMAGSAGLGYLITARGQLFDTSGLLALLVIVAVITVVLNGAITALEKRLTFWKNDQAVSSRKTLAAAEPAIDLEGMDAAPLYDINLKAGA